MAFPVDADVAPGYALEPPWKFFGCILRDEMVIDADGQRYADIYDWLFSLAPLGPDLPDFPHAGPAKNAKVKNAQSHRRRSRPVRYG